MTPRQRARAALKPLFERPVAPEEVSLCNAVTDAIEQAVVVEREACAKIADAEVSASESCDLEADSNGTARNIAAAIRARKDQT